MAQYENQAYLPAKWRLDGAGADTTLKLLDVKLTEKGTALEKKLTGDSAIPQRFAGFIDFEMEFTFLVDSTALPTATAPGFKFGAKGTLRFPVHTTTNVVDNWFQIHVMVLEAAYEIPNDDILKCTVKVAVDASANAQGGSSPVVYPT